MDDQGPAKLHIVLGSFGGGVFSLIQQRSAGSLTFDPTVSFVEIFGMQQSRLKCSLRLSSPDSARFHPVIAKAVGWRYISFLHCFTFHSWSTFTILIFSSYTPLSKNNRNEC